MIRCLGSLSALRMSGCFIVFMLMRVTGVSAGSPEAWLVDQDGGVRIWNPLPVSGESVHWRGGNRDSASGLGLVVWTLQGEKFEQAAGDWESGRLHGYAVWQHRDGMRYEGQWDSGRRHGFGVYTWPDGTRYSGLYHEGARQGGAVFNPEGKASEGLLTGAIRKQVLEAERAALRARKNATKSRQQALR